MRWPKIRVASNPTLGYSTVTIDLLISPTYLHLYFDNFQVKSMPISTRTASVSFKQTRKTFHIKIPPTFYWCRLCLLCIEIILISESFISIQASGQSWTTSSGTWILLWQQVRFQHRILWCHYINVWLFYMYNILGCTGYHIRPDSEIINFQYPAEYM